MEEGGDGRGRMGGEAGRREAAPRRPARAHPGHAPRQFSCAARPPPLGPTRRQIQPRASPWTPPGGSPWGGGLQCPVSEFSSSRISAERWRPSNAPSSTQDPVSKFTSPVPSRPDCRHPRPGGPSETASRGGVIPPGEGDPPPLLQVLAARNQTRIRSPTWEGFGVAHCVEGCGRCCGY